MRGLFAEIIFNIRETSIVNIGGECWQVQIKIRSNYNEFGRQEY